MYRKYRKRRYYNNYNSGPSLIEMLAEVIVGMGFLLGKLIFNLIIKLTSAKKNIKNTPFIINSDYKINTRDESVIEPVTLPINKENSGRYKLKESLITPAEENFLKVLKEVVGDKYIIENQVQLSRIVKPIDSGKNYTNYTDFNKIKAKSVDFVLFDKYYKPYLCIELDDRSHLRFDRVKRDLFVDEIMKSVNLRIIHIPVAYSYNIDDLRHKIFLN
jgi:hypothetical protein